MGLSPTHCPKKEGTVFLIIWLQWDCLTHCPTNNLNIRIKTEPDTVKDATIYVSGFWARHMYERKPDKHNCTIGNRAGLGKPTLANYANEDL